MEQKLIKIHKNGASLTIDLRNGGKILQLNLSFDGSEKTETIIQSADQGHFLGDGSYLMFPWVNRITDVEINNTTVDPLFKDGFGTPLHGLSANLKRKVVNLDDDSITFAPLDFNDSFPKYQETFKFLSNREFLIDIQLWNSTNQHQKFAVGYHPYIQLGDKSINDLEIMSNMEGCIQCCEKQLPLGDRLQLIPLEGILPNKQKISDHFIDNGFFSQADEKYVQVFDRESNKRVRIYSNKSISSIEALFWQIYTPPDRKRIAIEPQSSSADAFRILDSNLITLGPGEKQNFSFIIEASSE